MSKAYQVVGIGNAVSDVIATSGDEFLTEHGIEKGIMQLVGPVARFKKAYCSYSTPEYQAINSSVI